MKRSLNRPLFAILVLALSGCASTGAGGSGATDARVDMPAADAPADPPAAVAQPSSGAAETPAAAGALSFTDAQADRGRNLFRGSCTECHYSGEFSDSQFQFKWSRRTVGSLYQLIQTSMPETAPGSLMPEQTVDLVSYILRMNGFDPGATELAPDREALDAISLAAIR
jgi:mono/diheme cytochrome c family protein